MKKQSAVEWLVQQLVNDGKLIYDDYKAIEQAKEMEKEQIIEFGYDVADYLAYGVLSKKAIEDKYNETFKSE